MLKVKEFLVNYFVLSKPGYKLYLLASDCCFSSFVSMGDGCIFIIGDIQWDNIGENKLIYFMGVVNWEPNIRFSGNFRSFPEDFWQNHQLMGMIQLLFVGNSGHSDGAAGTTSLHFSQWLWFQAVLLLTSEHYGFQVNQSVHCTETTCQVLYRMEASISGIFLRSAPRPRRLRPPQDQVGGPLGQKWVSINTTGLPSLPCETGVRLDGVLALDPVHHVEVAHLILPCWTHHSCPVMSEVFWNCWVVEVICVILICRRHIDTAGLFKSDITLDKEKYLWYNIWYMCHHLSLVLTMVHLAATTSPADKVISLSTG